MPRTIPVLLVLLAALILCAGCITSLFPMGTRADYPSIDDVGTSPGTIPVHHTFPFQDRELTISCGCALFNLRIAAAHAGFNTECQLLPDPGDEDNNAGGDHGGRECR